MGTIYSIKFFIALFPYRLKIQNIFKRFYIVLSLKKKNTKKTITRICDILHTLDEKHRRVLTTKARDSIYKCRGRSQEKEPRNYPEGA